MRVELSKVIGSEGSVERVKADVDGSRAKSIRLKGDKVMSLTRMRGHLGLLGEGGGMKFGTGANSWNFDGFCVWMELERIIYISLFVLRRGRESKVTRSAEGAKGSMEVNRGRVFECNEVFKTLRYRFKVITEDRKMVADRRKGRGRGIVEGEEIKEGKKVLAEVGGGGGKMGDDYGGGHADTFERGEKR